MEMYVVTIDISYDFDNTIHTELFKDKEKAKEYMLKEFKKEINDTEYDTVEYGEDICSAYDEGFFVENHCEITIEKKNVK